MKKSIICIAKNEDNYIDEWISYHLKIGFDKVFVYQNNWRYTGDKNVYADDVEWIDFDGEAMQLKAYNDFIDEKSSVFDFAAFFDCDEFLRLPKNTRLDDFLENFENFYGIAVNWRLFGDSNIVFDGKTYSLVNRFTKCQKILNRHVKTILNIRKCRGLAHFVNPHFVDVSLNQNTIASASLDRFVHGPWNDNPLDNGVWINHYFCKTIDEYKSIKMPRGKADTVENHPEYFRKIDEFNAHNFNDIEDLNVKMFYETNSLNL